MFIRCQPSVFALIAFGVWALGRADMVVECGRDATAQQELCVRDLTASAAGSNLAMPVAQRIALAE